MTTLDDATRSRLQRASVTHGSDVRADAPPPAGYRRLEVSRRLGTGDDVFERARAALFSWTMHEAAGFGVRSTDEVARLGTDVLLVTRFGPLRFQAPCRVVRVVEGTDRAGFAYGTLPGHPVSGEEQFLLERRAHSAVVATISAVSRPASVVAMLGAPVTRREQRRIAERYLDALESSEGSGRPI